MADETPRLTLDALRKEYPTLEGCLSLVQMSWHKAYLADENPLVAKTPTEFLDQSENRNSYMANPNDPIKTHYCLWVALYGNWNKPVPTVTTV